MNMEGFFIKNSDGIIRGTVKIAFSVNKSSPMELNIIPYDEDEKLLELLTPNTILTVASSNKRCKIKSRDGYRLNIDNPVNSYNSEIIEDNEIIIIEPSLILD